MKNSVIRTLAVASLSVGSLLAMSACGAVKAAQYEVGTPVKVGLICLHDDTSTYDANFIKALDEAVADLGAEKVVYEKACLLTGVNEDQACFKAAKNLVKKGCNVIFADSFGHQDFMLEAAKKWPEVQFCHATGTNAKTANLPNYHNAFASIYEGRYLAGFAAGLKIVNDHPTEIASSQAMKVGYVGAFPYAEVKSGYTSWFLGVRAGIDAAAPSYGSQNLTMDVQFTNSWYAPVPEASAATSLITGGAVLVSQHADSMGAPGVCEDKGVPNVTYNIETDEACPNTYLAYSRINWAPYYKAVVNAVFQGKSIEGEVNHNWTGSLVSGSVEYNVNWNNVVSNVSEILQDATKLTQQALFTAEAALVLANGAKHVFDCSRFTVGGEHLTSYLADTDGDFAPDTEAIAHDGDVYFFNESVHCSAPYFDLSIDGINLPE